MDFRVQQVHAHRETPNAFGPKRTLTPTYIHICMFVCACTHTHTRIRMLSKLTNTRLHELTYNIERKHAHELSIFSRRVGNICFGFGFDLCVWQASKIIFPSSLFSPFSSPLLLYLLLLLFALSLLFLLFLYVLLVSLFLFPNLSLFLFPFLPSSFSPSPLCHFLFVFLPLFLLPHP